MLSTSSIDTLTIIIRIYLHFTFIYVQQFWKFGRILRLANEEADYLMDVLHVQRLIIIPGYIIVV